MSFCKFDHFYIDVLIQQTFTEQYYVPGTLLGIETLVANKTDFLEI